METRMSSGSRSFAGKGSQSVRMPVRMVAWSHVALLGLAIGCSHPSQESSSDAQSPLAGDPDTEAAKEDVVADTGAIEDDVVSNVEDIAQSDTAVEAPCPNIGVQCEPLQVGPGRCKREYYLSSYFDFYGNTLVVTRTRSVQQESEPQSTRVVLGHLRSDPILKPLYDRVVVESTVGVARFGMSYSWLENGTSIGSPPIGYACGGADLVFRVGPEWEREWIQSDDSGTLRSLNGAHELDPPCCGRTQCDGMGASQAECSEDFVLIWSPPEGDTEPGACVRVILLPKQDCSGTVTARYWKRELVVGMTCYTDKPVGFAVCFNGAKPSDYGWSEPQVDLPELTTADVNPEWPKF